MQIFSDILRKGTDFKKRRKKMSENIKSVTISTNFRYDDSFLLGCEAVSLGKWLPTFRKILLPLLKFYLIHSNNNNNNHYYDYYKLQMGLYPVEVVLQYTQKHKIRHTHTENNIQHKKLKTQ